MAWGAPPHVIAVGRKTACNDPSTLGPVAHRVHGIETWLGDATKNRVMISMITGAAYCVMNRCIEIFRVIDFMEYLFPPSLSFPGSSLGMPSWRLLPPVCMAGAMVYTLPGWSLGARTVFQSPGARTVFQSPGARTVFQSLGARTVFQSLGARTVFQSPGARTVFQSLGAGKKI
ncbi:MAG: hypothetical protein KKD44_25545 [Proteobacteria bacterium]|nr:hypothetical protein [Pseudomonadota bacterium]